MSSDLRNTFIDESLEILRASSPSFAFRKVAKRGLELGVFDIRLADRVKKKAAFPDWLIAGLSERMNPPSPSRKSAKLVTTQLVAHDHVEFSAPKCDPVSSVPPQFTDSVRDFPAMQHHVGGPSRHNLLNFQHMMLNDDGTIGELTYGDASFLTPLLAEAEPYHLLGHTFLGVVPGALIYAHWILDTLPRLLQMRKAGMDLTKFDNYVFSGTRHGFHRQVLEMLNIPLEKTYERRQTSPFVSVESFETVTAPRKRHVSHPSNFDLLRAFFFGDFEPPVGPSRRLYVSRQRSGRRRFVNGEDVGKILAQRGFEEVFAEEHSIADFARMMAEAKFVVGPHGAGLTNLVFCQPGTRVLEIYSAHLSQDYWCTSGQCGLDYHVFEGFMADGERATPERLASMPLNEANPMDILIDLDRFTDYLDNVFLV